MEFGGLQKFTLIDYPGRLAATLFLIGCNFRCPWCYSKELVLPEEIKKQPRISEKDFFSFLNKRKGMLEGVVLCGGEPTIHKDLPKLIKKIKKLGYFVKLDTNGSNPEMLEDLIEAKLIDYVAMDIKLPKEKYPKLFSQVKDIEKSINILKKGKVDYEFRTTVVPSVHSSKEIIKMARWIAPCKRYFLQSFRPEKTIDSKFEKIKPYSQEELTELCSAVSPFLKNCQIR